MTMIVVPNTFDGLVELERKTHSRLMDLYDQLINDPTLPKSTSVYSSAPDRGPADFMAQIVGQVFTVGEYLNESRNRECLENDIGLKLVSEAQFDTLTPHLTDGETGQDLRDGVIALTQAALEIRAPLGEKDSLPLRLTHNLLTYGTNYARAHLGSVWDDSRNPAGRLITTCQGVLQGGAVPFVSLKSGIKAVNEFVSMVCSYSHQPRQETQIIENFGMITNFGREIMREAEARLPQPPAPVAPLDAPIFTKAAAPSV